MPYSSQKEKNNSSVKKDITITMKALKAYWKVDRALIPLIISTSIFAAVQPYITIFLSGLLLDSLYYGKDIALMVRYAVLGISMKLVISLTDNYLSYIKWTKYRNMHNYQGILMSEKLMSMDYEYIESEEIQNMVRKQSEYSQAFGGVYSTLFYKMEVVFRTFISILISIFAVIPLFLKVGSSNTPDGKIINSPLFALGLIALIGLGMLISTRSMQNMQTIGKQSQENLMSLLRNFFYYFDNFLDGYEKGKDVRMFNMKNLISEENNKMIKNVANNAETMKKVKWRFELINQPISTLTGGLVYLFVGLRALVGAISIGNVVKFAGCIIQFIGSFSEFLTNLSALRLNNQYMEEMLYFLELSPVKHIGTIPVEKRRDNRFLIEFRHVYFKYPGTEDYVIKDMNMTFNIGERMAVVGRNGSGKTTFIKLLCRLYEPTEGQILLNGIDINKYVYEEYLKLFSVVFQDSRIYSFSVGNNVAASEEVDEERVKNALERAGLNGLLDKIPKGIDTYVYMNFDSDGVEISGGEAQRMEIARAIYQDRPFVIMDEPTAALDPIAEYEVYAGFNEMIGNKTAIYISHRLSSCRFCSDIIVFEDGNVVERGNHTSLVKGKGLYEKMWNAQAQYYADTKNAAAFQ
ncbi:MAG: ABC transporter ATP-binding protein [Bacillota bacterium]|nr:ABC transporter ATP-binding protein [Bacillota bacterium]